MRRAAAATDELRSEAQKGPLRRTLFCSWFWNGAGCALHPIYTLTFELGRARVARRDGLATGMRRGEILALRLYVDLDAAVVHVQRSLEETQAGLRFKAPRLPRRRTISLPTKAVAVLREHRRQLLEMRLALGLGKPDNDTLLFGGLDGSPMRPNQLSWLWRSACKALKLHKVSFHALRHTHASALIAAGLDVVAVSRRLGHANPTVTLNIYGHLFKNDDNAAAMAIDAVLELVMRRQV